MEATNGVVPTYPTYKGVDTYVHAELPSTADAGERLLARHATAWIKLCVSDRWLDRIEDESSPYRIWQMFEAHYQNRLEANAIDLQQQFFASRQGAHQTIDDYMDQVISKSRELKLLRAELPFRTIISHVISTLNASFAPARTSLKIQAPSLKRIDDLRDILLALQTDLVQQRDQQQQEGQAMALLTRHQESTRDQRGQAQHGAVRRQEESPFQDKQCD